MASASEKSPSLPRWLPAYLCMGFGAALLVASFNSDSSVFDDRRLASDADHTVEGIVNATSKILHSSKSSSSSEPLPFFVGLFSAIALKLTSSVDDVVWLVPFLIVPDKRKVVVNTVIYIWVCLIQTLLALLISHGGVAAIDALTGGSKNAWSADRLLTCISGGGLLVYGAILGKEWYAENYGEDSGDDDRDDDDGKDPESNSASSREGGSRSGAKEGSSNGSNEEASPLILTDEKRETAGMQQSQDEEPSKNSRTSSSLFVVAFLGSLDDLTLFVPMLVGQALSTISLVLGAFIAASIIVVLCMLMGMCKPVANFLESIPLCAIVLCFGTFLTVKALSMS